jgi:hypothetical protein
MFPATLRKSIALAALLVFSAALPASAAPPGYERLMTPSANSITQTDIHIPNWLEKNLTSEVLGSPGFRPVDFEIETFDEAVDFQSEKVTTSHRISFVEVENAVPLQESGWKLDLAQSPDEILDVLENIDARPIDLELYFRTESDVDGTVVVPRCACIWVPNKLWNESPWDFIPPMPEAAFYHELDVKYDEGWRPYDIEFAVDTEGHVFGIALLAPIVSSDVLTGTQWMATQWGWFTQSQLQAEVEAGWQLLDFERPVKAAPDPLIANPDQFEGGPVMFWILVQPLNPAQFSPTHAELHSPGSSKLLQGMNEDLAGIARLIDLEVAFAKATCSKYFCEGDSHFYEGLWLFP